MCLRISQIAQLVVHLRNETSAYINIFLQLFHEAVVENGGSIFHQSDAYSLVCWKNNSALGEILSENEALKSDRRKA